MRHLARLALIPLVSVALLTSSTADAQTFELASIDGANGFTVRNDTGSPSALEIVGALGDVNGDGVGDFGWTSSFGAGTQVFVVFGRAGGFPASVDLSSLDGANGFTITDTAPSLGDASSIRGVGDVNGDGRDDFAVGAPQRTPAAPDVIGFVVYGRASFPASFDYLDLDGSNGFRIGDSATLGADEDDVLIDAAGDVNGDGRDDFIVGSPEAGGTNAGAAFVVYGRATNFPALFDLDALDGSNGFVLPAPAQADDFGRGLGFVGDVNGDGRDDVAVGDPFRVNTKGFGRVWVLYGRDVDFPAQVDVDSLSAADGFVVLAEEGLGDLGWSLAPAGDFDADGVDDLLIGAPVSDPLDTNENAGAFVVVYGGSSLPASIPVFDVGGAGYSVSRSGANTVSNAAGGIAVASGDLDGDGVSDLAVGAPSGTVDETRGAAGIVYAVYGERGVRPAVIDLSSLDGSNGYVILGEGAGDNAGFTLDVAEVAGPGAGAEVMLSGTTPFMDDPEGSLVGAGHVVLGAPATLFLDDFETGDTSRWALTVD